MSILASSSSSILSNATSEELSLTGAMRVDTLSVYIRDVNRFRMLTFEEERALTLRISKGDQLAQQQLVQANLRLVISIAKKYIGQGMELIDLIQEGNIGLMHAVECFDRNFETHFSTYSTLWIRQAIRRAIEEKSRAIRLPSYAYLELKRIRKVHNDLLQEYHNELSTIQLSHVTGIEHRRIEELYRVAMIPLSLERPPSTNDDDTNIIEQLVDTESTVEDIVVTHLYNRSNKQELLNILAYILSTRDFLIVQLRYGLNGNSAHSFAEIGRKLGVTRERIRQIEERILQTLRQSLILRDFIRQLCNESSF